jgi:TonB-dependent SusC/RagA subfamily outer membrane receptor
MKRLRFILTIVFSAGIFISGVAQEYTIHGVVTTFDSFPLVGVSVKAKNFKQVVLTDTLGRFSVLCKDDDVIVAKAQGYYPQKAKINPKIKVAAINLKMRPGEKNREYSVGYWTVSEKDKLDAIVGMDDQDVDFSKYSNMLELIRGRFGNVQVINNEIRIRGISTINGSNAALLILDGTPIDYSTLSNLPPRQVKSIDIIKDGSASIYGANSANGVVVIQTKK